MPVESAPPAGASRPGLATALARPVWRLTTWFIAIAGGTLVGLLALMLGVALFGDGGGLPLVALLGILLAGLILAVAVYVDRRIIDPVERITSAARRLTAGTSTGTIRVEGPGEVNALAESVNQLAARLRAEQEAMSAERNRVGVVLSTMADGMVIVDRQLHVQRINDAATRLLHVTGEGAAGNSAAAVVRDHELFGVLQTAIAEARPCTADVRLTSPTSGRSGDLRDEPRYVRATGLPIPGAAHPGDPAGLLMLQDVTELKRSESIRREFVANVSHELRTPLASLKALVETLEEGALEDPPAAREFLAQMHVEVDSLAQMVQELLDLSKIESGQATLRPEAIPAWGLALDAEGRLRMQAERASVQVIVDAPQSLPQVWADPARVVQVLINLLHNAIKFTPAGGRVVLRVEDEGQTVRFTVADSGVGIAPLDLPRIFERFYKVDRSRASGGTGLGLAIAKHIIQAHGGRIWVESAGEGQGATFAFTLPAASR